MAATAYLDEMVDLHLPVLGVRAVDIPDRVIVVGDPGRAGLVAEQLTDATLVGQNREYSSYVGTFNGTAVGVVSHGVGAAGAAICFEELMRAGAQTIIRAGTAGALQDEVADGSLVIATGAVREEGLSHRLVPDTFPAVADVDVVMALRAATESKGVSAHCGLFLTNDLFYPHAVLGSSLELWHRAGVLATEMEASALLVIAALHGRRPAPLR
ncbi:MAG: nucleoside phosphorylase [Acidimicrobiales bacterium]